MKLIPKAKRKTKPAAAVEHRRGEGGRPLWVYFLPTVLVSILVLVLLAWVTLQTLHKSQRDANQASAQTAVQALAAQMSAVVDARRQQLLMLANSPSLRNALQSDDDRVRQRAALEAERLVPGILQLRLFAVGQAIEPQPEGAAPMGYAGVDLVTQALGGVQSLAEVHQLSAGKPYIALAVPVHDGEQVVGALFAAWPLKIVTRVAATAPQFPGDFQMLQGGTYVVAGSGPQEALPGVRGQEVVDGSIWQLAYSLHPVNIGGRSSLVLALAGGGILVLLLGIFLQYRLLGRDLRQDMATLVNLGEAILLGEGASEHVPKVAASRDAVLLLIDYARKRHAREHAAPAARSAAEPAVQALAEKAAAAVQAEQQAPPPQVPAAIFRAYDIRGVVEQELTRQIVFLLAQAFADTARQQGISQAFIARDARLSSPQLYQTFCEGLVDQGMHVMELGQTPVALLYYAMHSMPNVAAVMVTGSHNPAQYNGFKLYLDAQAVQGQALQDLRQRMLAGGFDSSPGSREDFDLRPAYLEAVSTELQIGRPLKLVVDAGNGVAGELACEVLGHLGCEVVPLFCEPDGNFPNHHPDPGQPDNLVALALQVQAEQADLGIAFDGDGDRIGLVDEVGEAVRPEHLLMLLAADILQRHPGTDVVYDVKSSRHLAAFILAHGGRPIMGRSGHTRMKEKMRESGALIGGEFSGHFFIKERWYGSDDAIYVAARLLELIAMDPRPLSEQLAELPGSPATPEYQLLLEEGEAGALMRAIEGQADFADAKTLDLDGMRVEFNQGWGLVRPSNTVPSLTFRFEADTQAALEQIQQRFRELMNKVLPDRQLPF